MTFLFKVVVFLVSSIGIAWISRTSLLNTQSHGFYRFFVWEAILALILLNLNFWFFEPFSFYQIISWLLLIGSSFLVIHGALLLRKVGKPDSKRKSASLLSIEKTTELVMVGAFRYIRHPIYGSLLFLAWGVFFKQISWVSVSLAIIATFFLIKTAKKEEVENIHFFGETYRNYKKQTKMFIPFLF